MDLVLVNSIGVTDSQLDIYRLDVPDCGHDSAMIGCFKIAWYGYQEKDKNNDKTGQSRAREWNEREKTSPKGLIFISTQFSNVKKKESINDQTVPHCCVNLKLIQSPRGELIAAGSLLFDVAIRVNKFKGQ
ncbi:hypothetical protein Tco_0488318 [Tanacetum coccineum]